MIGSKVSRFVSQSKVGTNFHPAGRAVPLKVCKKVMEPNVNGIINERVGRARAGNPVTPVWRAQYLDCASTPHAELQHIATCVAKQKNEVALSAPI